MTLNIKNNILITKAEANRRGIGQEPKQKYGGKKKTSDDRPIRTDMQNYSFLFLLSDELSLRPYFIYIFCALFYVPRRPLSPEKFCEMTKTRVNSSFASC